MKKIFLQLLPGFIPLFIFIIADEIWGTKIGLIVAIVVGVGELLYYWIKDKKFDKFILFDTLLIIALGVVSIILDNDVFFKLKPALIGVLMTGVLAISAFTPSNILLNMSKRYMRGMEFNDEQYKMFRKSIKNMFYIFVVYTALVFYSVWFMSDAGWAFVSGGLFYIIFAVYFVYEFVKTRFFNKNVRNEEWFPIVNENGEVIGKAPRSVCHNDNKLLHPVVHLHVFNDNGEVFLQKRAETKDIQPNKWDTSVGGHVDLNEDINKALFREAKEELGIKNFKPQFLYKYIWKSDKESELVFSFVTSYNGIIKTNKKEISEGRFWSKTEIEYNLNRDFFTPNFEQEFQKIKALFRK